MRIVRLWRALHANVACGQYLCGVMIWIKRLL